MPKFPRRGEVYQIDFNPARGAEIKKARPAIVISNNSMNELAATILVMPITSGKYTYFFRIPINPPEGGIRKKSYIVTEQITTVDKRRLGRRLGRVKTETIHTIEAAIRDNFELPESGITA